MSYQGHLPDGSSIQRHSAGTHYPFIVGKQEGQLRPWFVMDPSGQIIDRQVECWVAYENAEAMAESRRQNQARKAAMTQRYTGTLAQQTIQARAAEAAFIRPDCGEAGHADGACGNAQCLPSYRPPQYPDAWGVS